MKTVGVLGGMSSVASAEYYRLLNAGVNAQLGGHAAAEVVLYSVDFAVIERCITTDAWDEAAGYLVERARRLQGAGADFVLLATNTMHRVAPQIEAALDVPFVHLVDVVAERAIADGVSTLGLLGTRPVMEGDFYRERLARHGIDIVLPDPADRTLIDTTIFGELTRGVFSPATRTQYVRIMKDLAARGAGAMVLGCTEIDQLVAPDDVAGNALYDTTALHVERAVQLALDSRPMPPARGLVPALTPRP